MKDRVEEILVSYRNYGYSNEGARTALAELVEGKMLSMSMVGMTVERAKGYNEAVKDIARMLKGDDK